MLENGIELNFVVGFDVMEGNMIVRSNVMGMLIVYFELVVLMNKFVNEIVISLEFSFVSEVGDMFIFNFFNVKYSLG